MRKPTCSRVKNIGPVVTVQGCSTGLDDRMQIVDQRFIDEPDVALVAISTPMPCRPLVPASIARQLLRRETYMLLCTVSSVGRYLVFGGTESAGNRHLWLHSFDWLLSPSLATTGACAP